MQWCQELNVNGAGVNAHGRHKECVQSIKNVFSLYRMCSLTRTYPERTNLMAPESTRMVGMQNGYW